MPRLVGLDLGLEVLLRGRNLQGNEALAAGLVHELVEEGGEVAVAEAWLLSAAAHATQPWDREDRPRLHHSEIADAIARERQQELARMLGHEPAPLAILECVELGMIQPIDGAIRAEMSVFAHLIQRREPRNMIRTMFLGKQAYGKARRAGGPGPAVVAAVADIDSAVARVLGMHPDLARAGFGKADFAPAQSEIGPRFWFECESALSDAVCTIGREAARVTRGLSSAERLELDHLLAIKGIIPAYLGGAQGLVEFAAQ
jgi:3-hydroxyacyl-CoA dehydrogenase/enoyl-CoA hydratase/3-hydroxybutyryl-CoA epimerase